MTDTGLKKKKKKSQLKEEETAAVGREDEIRVDVLLCLSDVKQSSSSVFNRRAKICNTGMQMKWIEEAKKKAEKAINGAWPANENAGGLNVVKDSVASLNQQQPVVTVKL